MHHCDLRFYCLSNSAETLLWMFVCAADPASPKNPTFSDIQQNSVRLSWQPGATKVINKTSILFKKGSEEEWQSQLVTSSSSSSSSDDVSRKRRNVDEFEEFVLGGLESGTLYIISVEVQSFDKVSRSADVAFETREFCNFVCSFHSYYHRHFHRATRGVQVPLSGNLV